MSLARRGVHIAGGFGLASKSDSHRGRMKKVRLAKFFIIAMLLFAPYGCGGGSGADKGGNASSGDSGGGGSGTGIPGIDDIKQELLAAINEARSTARMCGATTYSATVSVTWNDDLAEAAYKHSADMATNHFFSHTGSDGNSPATRISQEGYHWSALGENIAYGYPTVEDVIQGWLGSEGHCQNIMSPIFTEIGAAIAGTTNIPYWTLDLAKPG
jgi:uncharacterized protein YkwD